MFLAILFIVLGSLLLLNALGIVTGNIWGLFWAIFFLALGIRMLKKKGICPACGWKDWVNCTRIKPKAKQKEK